MKKKNLQIPSLSSETKRQLNKKFYCFCGKESIQIDTHFCWYPCEDHEHLTPNEYKDAAEIHRTIQQLEKTKKEAEYEQKVKFRKS